MKKIFLFVIVGLLLVSVASSSETSPLSFLLTNDFGMLEPTDDAKLKIVSTGQAWTLRKHDGLQLQHFNTSLEDLGNGMANICLIPHTLLSINDEIITNSKAFLRKEGVSTGDVEPSDIEVEKEKGKVKKMCINVNANNEDWIKFGNESTIYEYQDINMLHYDLDFADVNITLYKNISGDWDNTVNDIFVFHNNDSEKFGANDTANEGLETYKYRLESNIPIKNKGNLYYVQDTTPKGGMYKTYDAHTFDFKDICSRGFEPYNVTDEELGNITLYNRSANCQFNYYEEVVGNITAEGPNEENITTDIVHYILEVTFLSDKDIDPVITIADSDAYINGLLDNVRVEEGNFSHLEINDSSAPYDSLVGYWSFDGDKENTTGTTAFDLSGNDNDGTLQGTAVINSSSGVYNNGIWFDGNSDYISIPDDPSLEGMGEITVSAWVYPLGLNGAYNAVLKKGLTHIWQSYNLFVSSAGNARFYLKNSSDLTCPNNIIQSAAGAIPLNTWTMITAKNNGTHNQLYINGSLVTTEACPLDSIYTGDGILTISIESDGSDGDYWNGSIDDVLIFNRSLSATQIQDIYNNQSARFKNPGIMTLTQFNQTLTSEDTMNISIGEVKEDLGSNVEVRVGEWEQDKGYFDVDLDAHYATFDGTGDYIDVNTAMSSFHNATEGTISVWMYPTVTPPTVSFVFQGDMVIGDVGQYSGIYHSNFSGVEGCHVYNYDAGSDVVSTPCALNEWVHITWRLNNSVLYGFKNGISFGSVSTGDTDSVASEVHIGGDTGSQAFNGRIDNIKMWNKSLNDSEILKDFEDGREQGYYENANLVSRWEFETDASDTQDNYDGTFQNDAAVESINDGLVAYYHLDNNSDLGENDTFFVDSSHNANNATMLSGSGDEISEGYYGGGVYFDGSDECIQYSQSGLPAVSGDDMTVSLWIKHKTTVDQSKAWFSYDNYMEAAFGDWNGEFIAGSLKGLSDLSAHINADEWNHFVVMYVSKENPSAIYVNGVNKTMDTVATAWAEDGETIGCRDTVNIDYPVNANFDEVMIWNRTMTNEEIAELYKRGRAKWEMSEWKNYTDGVEFTIQNTSTNFLPEARLTAGDDNFYTPYLKGDWDFEFYTGEEEEDLDAPSITLNYPENAASITEYTNFTTNITVTDATGIENCTIYANFTGTWEANQTNSTGITDGEEYMFPEQYNLSQGQYEWNAYCCDTLSNCGYAASNHTLTITSAADPCTTDAPNWNCSDNCTISTTVDAGGANASIIGNGVFTFDKGNLTNFHILTLLGESDTNKCVVVFKNGGGIK